ALEIDRGIDLLGSPDDFHLQHNGPGIPLVEAHGARPLGLDDQFADRDLPDVRQLSAQPPPQREPKLAEGDEVARLRREGVIRVTVFSRFHRVGEGGERVVRIGPVEDLLGFRAAGATGRGGDEKKGRGVSATSPPPPFVQATPSQAYELSCPSWPAPEPEPAPEPAARAASSAAPRRAARSRRGPPALPRSGAGPAGPRPG